MTRTADAIIIGTGVIGAAIAFEMAKAGWKTLSLDRNRQAGHGSTAGSCAIVRMHYSTFDGTAFAWEGYHYWRDWADYLALPKDTPLARFREVGCMTMKTQANGFLERHMKYSAELDCPFEELSAGSGHRRSCRSIRSTVSRRPGAAMTRRSASPTGAGWTGPCSGRMPDT
jgi:sarcosine oxidase subunit beta